MERTIIERGEGKVRAKLEKDRYGLTLLTMNNGRQWSGATIYNEELLDMIIEIIEEYKEASAT